MTSPDSILHQQVAGTFVGPVIPAAGQPNPVVVPVKWGAFDVPRLWSMVRRENEDPVASEQAQGFENLAQLLLSQHDSLKRMRNSLAEGWNPQTNEAARAYFSVLDALIASMASDAVAHASTGRGLDRILTALKVAKEKIAPVKQKWDRVTTDVWPEWWDKAADDLNKEARQVMTETDKAVGDHRQQLTVARPYEIPIMKKTTTFSPTTVTSGHTNGGPAGSQYSVPPVPGYDPVGSRGPDLQGLPNVPQPVPAVPGTPISVLPVPPGNPYAPGGGAYVLPGPGIGTGGRIYPMPTPPVRAGGTGHIGQTTGGRPGTGSAGQPGVAGMMPFTPAAGSPARTSDRRRPGSRDLIWQVAHGVPPVIGENPHEVAVVLQQQADQDADFTTWFSDLATPWDKEITPDLPRRTESTS